MLDLIIFLAILSAAYFIGTTQIEKKHYRSMVERERKFLSLPAVTARNIFAENQEIQSSRMVYGNVVISIDYFKKFLGGLRNIFGGEISSYETVLDRARREAILRMKESAKNADVIVNLRLETSTLGRTSQRSGLGCSEVLAYGTAVNLKKSESEAIKELAELSQNSQNIIERTPILEKKSAPAQPEQSNNLLLYIILGAGFILLLVFLFLLIHK